MAKAKGTGAAKKGVNPAKKMAGGGDVDGFFNAVRGGKGAMQDHMGGKGGGKSKTIPQNGSGIRAFKGRGPMQRPGFRSPGFGGDVIRGGLDGGLGRMLPNPGLNPDGSDMARTTVMKNGGKVSGKMPKSMGVAVKDTQKAPAKGSVRGGGAATRGKGFGKNG